MEISEELKQNFDKAKNVCVLTGAGISAESGVPTFRGGGESAVWKGMPFQEISSAQMVEKDLTEVWKWFDYRRGVLQECEPNAAHFSLVEWEHHFDNFTLVTQNVDGLHRRAGSKNVIEVHGNINRSRCIACEKQFQMDASNVPHEPTKCSDCGENVRPDVVLFGEMLPVGAFKLSAEKAETCDLFFIIGTSALVYPAASLPEIAYRNDAFLVEVNPEDTSLSGLCNEVLRGNAGDIIPELLNL